MSAPDRRTALIVGASRALGLALAAELLERDWDVIGTVRGTDRTGLHELADRSAGRLTVETLEMTDPEEVAALGARLAGRPLELLFVNAGIARENVPVAEVPTEDFVDVMVTNALAPMRTIEALGPLVAADGTIGIMSSRQGSVSLNADGGHEVYRASKSALNQLMRSYAARHAGEERTLLLIHPGWVQTDLGGAGAALTVDQSVPGIADTIEGAIGTPGLRFLDHEGDAVPW